MDIYRWMCAQFTYIAEIAFMCSVSGHYEHKNASQTGIQDDSDESSTGPGNKFYSRYLLTILDAK